MNEDIFINLIIHDAVPLEGPDPTINFSEMSLLAKIHAYFEVRF